MDEEIKRANTDIWVKWQQSRGDMLVEQACQYPRIDDHEERHAVRSLQNKIYWIIGIPAGITGLLVTLLLTGCLNEMALTVNDTGRYGPQTGSTPRATMGLDLGFTRGRP